MTLKSYATVERREGKVWLTLDEADKAVSDRIAHEAIAKGKRVRIEISLERPRRTDAQNALYWVTLPQLYFAVFYQWPNREELEEFHEDFKMVHGFRRTSVLDPQILVPIRMRDTDVSDAGHYLTELFIELSDRGGDMGMSAQTKARDAWFAFWENGGPYYHDEEDFRRQAKLCAACGKGGVIQLCHIVSRGADHERINDPTNWLPCCLSCHGEQHQIGDDAFLAKHPHLKTRWDRAKDKT